MSEIIKIKVGFVLLLLFTLSACSFSTAADITPPPDAQVVMPTAAEVQAAATEAATEDLVAAEVQVAEETTAPVEATADAALAAESEAQADTQPEVEPIEISGRVINLSGGEIPAGLEVFLQAFEGMEIVFTQTTELKPDGTFTFEEVESIEGLSYIFTLDYEGVVFGSEVIPAESLGSAGAPAIEIAIYDKTSDHTALYADRAHIFFEFLSTEQVQVVVYLLVSNPTEYVVVAEGAEDPVLSFTLPLDAVNLQFEDTGMSSRYIPVEGGFGDLMNIRPGLQQHEILYAYELPFDGERELAFSFPVEVRSGMLIAPEGLQLSGSDLQAAGEREMENGVVTLYNFDLLPVNEPLEVALSGESAEAEAVTGSSTMGIAIGLGVFALVLVAAGLWLRRKPATDAEVMPTLLDEPLPETQEALLDAIVVLDQDYEDGNIDRVPYLSRRAKLKERLINIRELREADRE